MRELSHPLLGDVLHPGRLLAPLALVIVAEYWHLRARGESSLCHGLLVAYSFTRKAEAVRGLLSNYFFSAQL